MKCGREPEGANVEQLGVCPAATDRRLDGIHGGMNSGRACWVIAGTFCNREVQGTFAVKYRNCASCLFFRQVLFEEGSGYYNSLALLKKLKVIKS